MKDIKQTIQEDLDNGKYGMICSNEDTFKKYVFPLIALAEQRGREEERKRYKEGFKKLAVERKALMKRISKALKNNSPSEE